MGEGLIGAEPFGWLLQDRRANGIPCILETPQQVADVGDDDQSPDAWDVETIAQLRVLAANTP